MLILLVMLLKPTAWFFAFLSALGSDAKGMLLRAAGVTLILTLADKVSVASNLTSAAIMFTLVLYALMSFTLIPLAWKLKNKALSIILNLTGMLGAFVMVNFLMDFLRGFMPFMNR